MLPLQYDLQLPNARHKSITHAPAAERNLNATIPLRSAETELKMHNRISHNGYINCSSKTEARRPSGKTTILKQFFKRKIIISTKMKRRKICCQSTIRNFQADTTIRFTTATCKHTIKIARLYWRTNTIRAALAHPFHCDLHRATQ